VHLSDFPAYDAKAVDKELEERMELAQKISSMILSIRKKENIRVRQPLNKVQIPVLDEAYRKKVEAVKGLILSEVNVKEMELVDESQTKIVKNLKLNFKTLGKKCGKDMKAVQAFAAENGPSIISGIERSGNFDVNVNGSVYTLIPEDVEIIPVDIPGWKVANEGQVTVALDVIITEKLREEGIARELVNRIQNIRKTREFDVTDRINVRIKSNALIDTAISNNLNYICSETLASSLEVVPDLPSTESETIEVDEETKTLISVTKLN
jgi:isoleucyl-tRNA synthetase